MPINRPVFYRFHHHRPCKDAAARASPTASGERAALRCSFLDGRRRRPSCRTASLRRGRHGGPWRQRGTPWDDAGGAQESTASGGRPFRHAEKTVWLVDQGRRRLAIVALYVGVDEPRDPQNSAMAAAGRKGKVRAAGLFPVAGGGGRSGSVAGHLPFGRGSNLATSTSQQRNQHGVVPAADAARRLPSSGSSPTAGVLAVGCGSSPSGGVHVGLGFDMAAGGVLPVFPNTGSNNGGSSSMAAESYLSNNGSPALLTNTFPSQSWWCSVPSW